MSRSSRLLMLALAVGVLVAAVVVLGPDDPQPVTAASSSTTRDTAQSPSKGDDHGGHAGGHAPSKSSPSGGDAGASIGDDAPLIRTRGNEPVGGLTVIRKTKGEMVRFAVASDTADEVHVHGYDVTRDVTPSRRAALAFPADIEGVFEVELENAGAEIARLIVEPR